MFSLSALLTSCDDSCDLGVIELLFNGVGVKVAGTKLGIGLPNITSSLSSVGDVDATERKSSLLVMCELGLSTA